MVKKLKTHSWAKKTFKVTKKGKLIADKACNNHLLTNKGKNNKKFAYWKVIDKTRMTSLRKLLPYV